MPLSGLMHDTMNIVISSSDRKHSGFDAVAMNFEFYGIPVMHCLYGTGTNVRGSIHPFAYN